MKILTITSIRSEYNLLSGLLMRLHQDPGIDSRVLVSGTHLSPTYGNTVQEIEKAGFRILLKIESLIDSDSKAARLKSASIFLQNSIDTVNQFSPDLILYAGDREDCMVGALLGGYLGIPTLHFYGGDHVPDGNIDNPIRHATSKLSSVHFVAHKTHQDRLIALGEDPARVFCIGSIALDKFRTTPRLSKSDIQNQLGLGPIFEHYAVAIFHPILEEADIAHEHVAALLTVLQERKIPTLIGYPNIDSGNKKIIHLLGEHRNNPLFHIYKNMDQALFLSVFAQADFLIGNSSAGIMEAASIPIPVINVGSRQVGRYADANVVFCNPTPPDIRAALDQIQTPDFQKNLATVRNSYGDGFSTQKAHELIKQLDFKKFLFKKEDPLS